MVYRGTVLGITVYDDGIKVGADTVKETAGSKPGGNGIVFIGRRLLGGDLGPRYTSVQVDELKMYNIQLSEEEICKMY